MLNNNNFDLERRTSSTSFILPTSPIVATYRPIKCPVTLCPGILSPSNVMTHFEYMHRGIPIVTLNTAEESCASINVSMQYLSLKAMKPAVISIVLLQGSREESVPLILNMNLLPKVEYQTIEKDGNDSRPDWLAIWLSSLHTFPCLFNVTVENYGLPKFSFSQQCAPISLHEENNNTMTPLEDARIVVMNCNLIEKVVKVENGLYLELTAIPTEPDGNTLTLNRKVMNFLKS